MGEGEGFSSSLVYALIKISACGTIVRVNPEKIRDKFLYYNLTHAQSVCTRLSFPSRPALSGEPGFEANTKCDTLSNCKKIRWKLNLLGASHSR